MAKYRTAAQLGILPEERKALIAFSTHEVLGMTISVNGHAHYYIQGAVDNERMAAKNECGTAGCVAGFVFAHAKHVQGKKGLRGARSAQDYINKATEEELTDDLDEYKPITPLLNELYSEGNDYKLSTARKVVTKLLKTGKVNWPAPDLPDYYSFED